MEKACFCNKYQDFPPEMHFLTEKATFSCVNYALKKDVLDWIYMKSMEKVTFLSRFMTTFMTIFTIKKHAFYQSKSDELHFLTTQSGFIRVLS